jgi:hypothetical protein
MELALVADKLVAWRESIVCLLDAVEKIDIQGRVAGAKLDDTSLIAGDDGVAVSALYRCRVNRHACKLFGPIVALLLRRRSVFLKEVEDLILG